MNDYRVGLEVLDRDTLLHSAGLLVDYGQAEGDYLFWSDEDELIPVLDFVGGFGSTLLGHNHPEIVAAFKQAIDQKRPMHAQAANRVIAKQLRETMQDFLRQYTNKEYQILFLSTGTEAVEAALKHAEYEYTRRLIDAGDVLSENVRRLRYTLENQKEVLSESFFRDAEKHLKQEPIEDLDALLLAMAHRNQQAFNAMPIIAAFKGAFHGKTKGSLAHTWNRDARLPFIRNQSGSYFIQDVSEFKHELEAMQQVYYDFQFEPLRLVKKTINRLAAIIYEPIQGEGGIVRVSDENQDLLRWVKEAYPETAMIADEIQCGLGRSGHFVESSKQNLPNDYLTFGKSLGGGLCKLSALAIEKSRYYPEFSMLHSSTFADDDLSCAVGKRTLEILMRDQVAERCAQVGLYLKEHLMRLQTRYPDVVKQVRGEGTMLGLVLHSFDNNDSAVLANLNDQKMLTVVCAGYLLHEHHIRVLPPLGNRQVIRIQPSAYVSQIDLDRFIVALSELFDILHNKAVARLLAYLVHERVEQTPVVQHPVRDEMTVTRNLKKIGFISHLIDKDSMREIDPALDVFDEESINALTQQINQVSKPGVVARRIVRGAFGYDVELVVYGIQMDANQIEDDIYHNRAKHLKAQVHNAYRQAREEGCTLVGFGGYTSIVTNNCLDFSDDFPAVTTGNTLTVACSLETLKRVASDKHIQLNQVCAAVCGARGNIGQIHAQLLAEEVGRLILVGRQGSREGLIKVALQVVNHLRFSTPNERSGHLFRQLSLWLREQPENINDEALLQFCEVNQLIEVSETLDSLAQAEVIVSASNSAKPIIQASHLSSSKQVLISDIAVPGDTYPEVANMVNVSLIRGGIVSLLHNKSFSLPGMLLEPGRIYACAGETVLLGLAGVQRHFSMGPVSAQQVKEITGLAALYGFDLGQPKFNSVFI